MKFSHKITSIKNSAIHLQRFLNDKFKANSFFSRKLLSILFFTLLYGSLTRASVTMISDTTYMTNDGSRLAISINLGDISALGTHVQNGHISNQESRILLVIPSDLTEEARNIFVDEIKQQMELNEESNSTITLLPIDIPALSRVIDEVKIETNDLDINGEEKELLTNHLEKMKLTFINWRRHFLSFSARMKDWKQWPAEQKLMLAGSFIGLGKSALSIGFWIPSTGANIYGYSQAAMSLFLDVFFARWGHRVEAWKGRHLVGTPKFFETSRVYKKVINTYNYTPVLKAFIIDNLISISAGTYFRTLSWAADTTGKIESALSLDFAQNVLGGMTIGGISGAAGGQGVRTLRRKGYIGPKPEYFLYQLFGLGMQIGGFLNGAGLSTLYWIFLKSEAIFKVSIYLASRVVPNRRSRVLLFHSELPPSLIKDITYQHGMYDALEVTDENLKEEIEKHQPHPGLATLLRKKWPFVDKIITKIEKQYQCVISVKRRNK